MFPFRAPRDVVKRKPPHGSPCTRCGLCCMATLCELGRHVYGREVGPCPALKIDGQGAASCGLTESATLSLDRAAAIIIGAGLGCDMRINGEPVNHSFNHFLDEWDKDNDKQIKQARKQWGMTPEPQR